MCKEHLSRVLCFCTQVIFSPRHRYPSFVSPRTKISSQNRSRIIDRSYIYISPSRDQKRRLNSSSAKYIVCFEKPPSCAKHCCFLMDFKYSEIIYAVLHLRSDICESQSSVQRVSLLPGAGAHRRKREKEKSIWKKESP